MSHERIYIETVEEIFSNVEKIIIDEPNGGSGVVPYLPLRELNKSAGGNKMGVRVLSLVVVALVIASVRQPFHRQPDAAGAGITVW